MVFWVALLAGIVLGLIFFRLNRPLPHVCNDRTVVDCENLSIYLLCDTCGKKTQLDFHYALEGNKNWIGFQSGENKCPLCMGWKKKAWSRCAIEVCELNPEGPIYPMPDGSWGHRLDG